MIFVRVTSYNRYQITGYRQWAKLVKLRDHYTCRKCGTQDRSVHAHHIKNFAHNKQDRININNAITLCGHCHSLFHQRYGYRNNNIWQLKSFLSCGV